MHVYKCVCVCRCMVDVWVCGCMRGTCGGVSDPRILETSGAYTSSKCTKLLSHSYNPIVRVLVKKKASFAANLFRVRNEKKQRKDEDISKNT